MNVPYPQPATAPRRSSAATAIVAAGLTVLTGLWHVVGLVLGIVTVSETFDATEVIVGIGLNAIVAGVSLVGAVALFARQRAGRVMTVLGCVLAIALYVFLALRSGTGSDGANGIAAVAIVGLPALVAVVLALLPSTGRWLDWGEPAVPVPSYRPSTSPRRIRW